MLAHGGKGEARFGQAGPGGADGNLGQPGAGGRDLQRRADGHQLALKQDGDPVGHLFGLCHVVGGEDDGGARGLQLAHHIVQLDA